MLVLPDEVILHCLRYLDPKSLTKLSLVCRKMNALTRDNALWLSACLAHQPANRLIKAAGIETLLRSSLIPPAMFFKSVLTEDIESLKKHLFPEATKIFSLWLASYEKPSPSFFNKPHAEFPWSLFLARETGKNKTENASSVKEWLQVKVPINAEQFEILMNKGMIPYKEAIALTHMGSYKSKMVNTDEAIPVIFQNARF